MPVVAPVSPVVSPPADGATTRAAQPGFAAALDTAAGDVASLPSIGLARMIAIRAGAAPAAAPAGIEAAASAGPVTAAGAGGGAADPLGIIAAGERYLGVPYRWGGTDPATGMDCSGFVQRVFADRGISLPRVSIDQSKQGVEVGSLDAARPGDLVFWHGTGSRPNHIGIYAGDGKMLVAPRTGDVVRYQDITRTPDTIRRVT